MPGLRGLAQRSAGRESRPHALHRRSRAGAPRRSSLRDRGSNPSRFALGRRRDLARVHRMRALLLLCAACASPNNSALERVELPFRPGRKVDRLLVVIHQDWRSFEQNGLIDDLVEHAIELDIVTVGSERPDFAERLHDDLIFPKRQEGYTKIWILGIARGGLGAISFSRRYAN